MDISEAQKTGYRIVLKTLTIFLLVAECINLFLQTKGDFANGILFFIDGHFKAGFIVMLVILYGSAYFLGRKAGKDILIQHKNYLATGMRYAFLSVIVLSTVMTIAAFIPLLYLLASRHNSWTPVVIEPPVVLLVTLSVIIFLVWLFAVVQIRRKGINPDQ